MYQKEKYKHLHDLILQYQKILDYTQDITFIVKNPNKSANRNNFN